MTLNFFRSLLILGLTIATCVYLAEIPLISLLLPEISEELGADSAQIRLFSISYGFFVALSVLAAGWLGDKFGIRLIIVCGVTTFCIGSVLISFSDLFFYLVFGRILQGIGGGLFAPLVPVALVRLAPLRPGRSLALYNFVIGVIIAIAPLIATPIVDTYGWRSVLLALSATAVISLLAIMIPRRELSLQHKIISENTYSKSNPRMLSILMLYVALNYGIALLFLFWAPLAIERASISTDVSAAVLSITWLSFGLVAFLIRRGIDTEHVSIYLLSSPIVMAVGWYIFLFANGEVFWMVLAGCVVGCGLGLGNAPSTLVILNYASQKRSALAVSLDVSFARLGSVVFIWLLGSFTDPQTLGIYVVLACVLNAVCAIPLRTNIRFFNNVSGAR